MSVWCNAAGFWFMVIGWNDLRKSVLHFQSAIESPWHKPVWLEITLALCKFAYRRSMVPFSIILWVCLPISRDGSSKDAICKSIIHFLVIHCLLVWSSFGMERLHLGLASSTSSAKWFSRHILRLTLCLFCNPLNNIEHLLWFLSLSLNLLFGFYNLGANWVSFWASWELTWNLGTHF